ncbi:hypothetical protein Acy02nite_48460 [Actinoplanes cyaneus]|uniref:Uncharacterized protein n=1 Tax=Actinoplanes cyaneus TaxID=52696 RepID=A0A919M281_9ACTN|nr:hypothetical protein Acy02nite_48460 [Actinoplanes cyaneus]
MSVGALCVLCTANPSAGVAVTSETTPSLVILITARPPFTVKDLRYVRSPSPPVVTVQPSTVVAAGSVLAFALDGFGDGLDGFAVGVVGWAGVVTDRLGAGRDADDGSGTGTGTGATTSAAGT